MINPRYDMRRTPTVSPRATNWTAPAISSANAAECAIKSAIEATRPTAQAPHIHLPRLVHGARKALQGRRAAQIFRVLEQADFMDGCDVDLRYRGNGAVGVEQFRRWRRDATRALAAANLKPHQ